MEKATLGTLIIRYILTGYMCMCLQLSGCVNLKFCTFICWDSLVNSAAVAEYDGDMWSSAMQVGTLLFCSGDCPGVCTAWFWWHLHCAFSVCQLNIWVTQFSQVQLSATISGDTELWLFSWVEKQRNVRKLPKHGLFLCNSPSSPLSVICWYFDENSN